MWERSTYRKTACSDGWKSNNPVESSEIDTPTAPNTNKINRNEEKKVSGKVTTPEDRPEKKNIKIITAQEQKNTDNKLVKLNKNNNTIPFICKSGCQEYDYVEKDPNDGQKKEYCLKDHTELISGSTCKYFNSIDKESTF